MIKKSGLFRYYFLNNFFLNMVNCHGYNIHDDLHDSDPHTARVVLKSKIIQRTTAVICGQQASQPRRLPAGNGGSNYDSR